MRPPLPADRNRLPLFAPVSRNLHGFRNGTGPLIELGNGTTNGKTTLTLVIEPDEGTTNRRREEPTQPNTHSPENTDKHPKQHNSEPQMNRKTAKHK